FVVVKALGGEEVRLPKGMEITMPENGEWFRVTDGDAHPTIPDGHFVYFHFPEGCKIRYSAEGPSSLRSEAFTLSTVRVRGTDKGFLLKSDRDRTGVVTEGWVQVIPGSSWGTFTIAMTIPIALFVAFWMYRFRKGRVVEASLIGAVGVLLATVAGGWIQGSPLEHIFSLTKEQTIFALCAYGLIPSVLPGGVRLLP